MFKASPPGTLSTSFVESLFNLPASPAFDSTLITPWLKIRAARMEPL